MGKSKRKSKLKVVDESWYSIYVVWALTMIGLVTLIFGNIFFKVVGIVVVIMGLGVLVQIAKKRREAEEDEPKGDSG